MPPGLVGPSSDVPVQIEGIYTRALIDSGSQVTLLYRSFYDSYLKHLPLQPIEQLEIWGLSAHKYPYDGYLPVQLRFTETVTGVPQTVDTLALVCPDPVTNENIAILVGTNTQLVRTMFESCREQAGEEFLKTLVIHPVFREAYKTIKQTDLSPKDTDKHGTVWFAQRKAITVKPGQVFKVTGLPKFPGELTDQLALIDQPKDTSSPEELQVRPEVHPSKVVFSRRITVTVKNMSSREILLKRGTPLAHIYPVASVHRPMVQSTTETAVELTPESFDFGTSTMPEEAKKRLCERMMERKEVFSCHEWDVGCSKSTRHEIRLKDARPFRERSRRLSPADFEDVRKHLHDLQNHGIISESRSPYASPIVVVRKKSGKVRMCVDYRTLNLRTIPDQYTVPRIEDALHSLSGSKWFTVLDLRSGYYQIPMSESDKEKTAFICPLGFYQFERMPQGISGAPATFQRVMERTVGDMNFLEVLVYLDDVIVFGRTLEEHEERLLKVLDRLEEEGLKLSLDKCQFGRTSVTYVGHVVSQDGVATDPSKIEAVATWPRPQTVTALRSYLGFCGYYRRFVKDYSKLCRPLNGLLKGYPPSSRSKGSNTVNSPDKTYFKPSEPFGSRWNEQCEQAFQELKTRLTKAPVLLFADPQKPYVLHVDASLDGLGGVLYQEHGDGLRPVAFISRSLSPSERNYPAHKLEFLALKWAVVDKLHDYLYGAPVQVITDNNPLTYILTSAKLDATGHRWLSALSTYTFSLKYRPGRQNIDADSLSRRPHDSASPDDEWQEIPVPGVRALCQTMSSDTQTGHSYLCMVEPMGASVSAIPKVFCHTTVAAADQLPTFSPAEIQAAQKGDPCLGKVWLAVSQRAPASYISTDHSDITLLKRDWGKLSINQGLLYRTVKQSDQRIRRQLVLPKQYHNIVLKSLHDSNGHLGFDKTYALVCDRFFWPRMKLDVEAYCKTCERCIKRKTLPQRAAPLSHIHSSGPMDLVCIDFLSIEPDSRNVCNVLVITDHFTRYAQAIPTKDQKAITVARTLWEKYFIHYGVPTRIHSDQGRDFESQLVKEMLTMLGVRKSRTSPYHPQGDPQPERFNRTLLNMLGTLEPSQKSKWSQHIAHLVHAYNCTPNEATGYSPYFLMFGREARLPVDVCFGVSADGTSTTSHLKYISKMKKELQAAYQLAKSTATKMNQSNKERYDQRVRYHRLNPGDKVLLRNLGLKGKQKLADRWGHTLYVVEGQLSDLPVYRLKPVNGSGPVKVMHRNHILPLGQGIRLSPEVDPDPVPTPRAFRRRKAKERRQDQDEHKVDSTINVPLEHSSFSDSESECGCYVEDVIIDTPEICDQTEPEVIESDAAKSATEVPRVSECSEELPAATEDCAELVDAGEEREVEQGCPIESTCTEADPTIVNSVPELRKSVRDRKPAERFTYEKLGEPCIKTVVAKHIVHLPMSLTTHFPKHYSSCHTWWCDSFAKCKLCMSRESHFPNTVVSVI